MRLTRRARWIVGSRPPDACWSPLRPAGAGATGAASLSRRFARGRRLALAAVLAAGIAGSGCDGASRTAVAITGGDPERGRAAVRRYGCTTCHTIPRVPGAVGIIGPPLQGMARRAYVAGRLENTPANLARWIQHPQHVDPPSVMPEMGVTEPDSRDIAAFLYTLR